MYFGERTDKYFACWILQETWYTRHGSDLSHFHLFMNALLTFRETRFSETDFREKILRAARNNHRLDEDHLKECVDRYVSDAWAVVEYLEAVTKYWPDRHTEQTDFLLK